MKLHSGIDSYHICLPGQNQSKLSFLMSEIAQKNKHFYLFQRKVYYSVVEDVISNVREAFLDEGVDEQVLQELKQVGVYFLTVWHKLHIHDL